MGRPGVVLSLVTPDQVACFIGRMKKLAGGVQVSRLGRGCSLGEGWGIEAAAVLLGWWQLAVRCDLPHGIPYGV
jgi:hypothetical protein